MLDLGRVRYTRISSDATQVAAVRGLGRHRRRGQVVVRELNSGVVRAGLGLRVRSETDRLPAVVWSDDGRRLIVAGRDEDGRCIRVLDAGSGALVSRIDDDQETNALSIAPSPNGDRIAVVSPAQARMLVRDSVTGDVLLASDLPVSVALWPTWSPDGERLAILGLRNIVIVDAMTGASATLPGRPTQGTQPAWSPDGLRLAFAERRRSRSRLTVLSLESPGAGNTTPLTTMRTGTFADLIWSRDGESLAFTYSTERFSADFREAGVSRLPGASTDRLVR